MSSARAVDSGARGAGGPSRRCCHAVAGYRRCRLPHAGQTHAYGLGGARCCITVPHLHSRVLYGVGSNCRVEEVIATCCLEVRSLVLELP